MLYLSILIWKKISYIILFHAQMLADIKPRILAVSSQGYTWAEFLKKIKVVGPCLRK